MNNLDLRIPPLNKDFKKIQPPQPKSKARKAGEI
jgi:hypothetical protein